MDLFVSPIALKPPTLLEMLAKVRVQHFRKPEKEGGVP